MFIPGDVLFEVWLHLGSSSMLQDVIDNGVIMYHKNMSFCNVKWPKKVLQILVLLLNKWVSEIEA